MFDIIKSVSRHFVVYGLGNILNRIVGFLLIPLYTHYLTTSDYGTLELLELTTAIVGMFLAAGVSFSVLRFYYDDDDEEARKTVVSTAHLSIWAFTIFLGGWLLLFSYQISGFVFGTDEVGLLFRLTFITLILSVASEVPMVFLRAEQKSGLFTAISVSRFTVSVLLNILFLVYFGWGIKGIVLSSLITQVATSISLSIYTIYRVGVRFSMPRLWSMLKYGLPYIPGGLSRFILNFADRFLLQRMAGLSDVGIYALGYKFGMVISPLVTEPFRAIWGPKMFEVANHADVERIYAKMMTYFIFIELFAGLGISVLVKDVIQIMSPEEFWRAYEVVPLIVLSYIVWGAHYSVQVGILLAKKTHYIAIATTVGAVVNVAANWFLIPPLGLWGAAISTLASFLLVFGLSLHFSNKFKPVRYEAMRTLKMLAAAIGLYLVSLSLPVANLWVSMSLKVLLVLTYPGVLYLLSFYEEEERIKLKSLFDEHVAARLRRT